MNPRMWCFDLEMNKPHNEIIQIGGCIGDIRDGSVLHTFNYYIKTPAPISPYITELTGITTLMTSNLGVPLDQAAMEIQTLIDEYKASPMPIVWGNGDLRHLKGQICCKDIKLLNIHRELDIKTIHQFYQLASQDSIKGGLAKSMEKYGLKFQGTQHNALDDALNTFKLAHRFYTEFSMMTAISELAEKDMG